MKTACTTQCAQCPFRRDSLPSYLGDYTAASITTSIWRNQPFYCHTKINYANPGWATVAQAKGKLCLGSMAFADKIKAPLRADKESDRDVLAARKANAGRVDIECMDPVEFGVHHDPATASKRMKTPVKKPAKKAAFKLLPQLKGKPTEADIKVEVARLREMLPFIRPTSLFGDDNVQSLNDQIWVLDQRADNDEIYERFDLVNEDQEPDEDERAFINEADKRSMERADNAMEARRWMDGDVSDRPSANWYGLIP